MSPPPSASHSPARPSRRSMEQAADWFALLRSGRASTADQARWQQWQQASSDHALAWKYVESVNQSLAPIQTSPSPQTATHSLLEAHQFVLQRRKLLALMLLVAGSGTLAWAGWRHTSLPGRMLAWGADFRTGTGEIESLTLPDKGQIWLDTASAINLDYNTQWRRIELVRGRVLIDTAPDTAQRPFFVDTRQGRLQALGTRFTVTQGQGETQLAVYEGAVRAQPRHASAASGIVAQAGEQIVFSAEGLVSRSAANPAEQAWEQHMLQAGDLSLRELVGELNRYWPGHISVADEVAELRIFGSFPLHDIPATLRILASSQPVRLSRPLPWWLRLDAL